MDVKKVFVVIIDKKLDNIIEEVRNVVVLLEGYKICVIFVVFGWEVDVEEFINIIFDKNDLVKVDKDRDLEKIVEEIIMRVSKFVFI